MLEIILTGVAFIVIFSALVLVHEFGHFITAKKSGVKVEEFGMGLPPRAWTVFKDKSGTIYSLNWIPFGGFVKMLGEDDGDEETKNDPKSFMNQPLWKRMLIVTAGVIMNFFMAIVLLTIVFTAGFYPLALVEDTKIPINSYLIQRESFAEEKGYIEEYQIYIGKVEEKSLAATSGMAVKDRILSVDGNKPVNEIAMIEYIRSRYGNPIAFKLLREEKEVDLTISTTADQSIGFYPVKMPVLKEVKFAFPESALKATEEVARQSYITLVLLKDVVGSLVQKFAVPAGVAGPVGIVQMTNTFVKLGIIPLLIFVSLLSISLGVLNIMPFPALDGGRFLFMLFELIMRKKPNAKVETAIHGLGFALLMLLIVVVTWNDIWRLIQG